MWILRRYFIQCILQCSMHACYKLGHSGQACSPETRKMLERGASMKGKKEGGEKKGKEGRKKGEGKKKEKEREFNSRARTRDLPLYSQLSMATTWR